MSYENPTFKQISEQDASGEDPTVLLRRTDDTISTARLTGDTDEHGRYWAKFEDGYKPISPDNLSDKAQAELAEQLSGKKLLISIGRVAMRPEALAGQNTPGFIDHVPAAGRVPDTPEVKPVAEKNKLDRIKETGEALDAMVAGLSAGDIDSLYRFSRYQNDKADAQKDGDGEGSQRSGQYAGQELRAMSPAARSISQEFHDTARHLQWLQDLQE